jgi:hypothetical protein
MESSLLDSSNPKMSVILVCLKASKTLAWVLEQLSLQTVARDLECLLVTTKSVSFDALLQQNFPFSSLRVIELAEISSEGEAKAAGIHAARAPLVAFLEDHTFPAPGWAQGLLEAHSRGRYAAAGPVVSNANPFSWISWGSYLVYYGEMSYPQPEERIKYLPANHSCYRKELLLEYGERLPDMLEMEPVLHADLLARGYRLFQEAGSIAYHLNFSNLKYAAREYYHASRIFAAQRRDGWGLGRRLVYTAGSPLLPLVRMKRIAGYWAQGGWGITVFLKAFVPALILLAVGAAGEMLGYSLGPGGSCKQIALVIKDRDESFSDAELEKVRRRLKAMRAQTGRQP